MALAGAIVLGVILVIALAFGALQTRPGKIWLAGVLSHALSSAPEQVTVTAFSGLVPFDMGVGEIVISDAKGPRLAISRATLVIAPDELLLGRLKLRLNADDVRILRPSSEQGGGYDLSDVTRPPIPITLEPSTIGRLELGPALLGEPMSWRLEASGHLGEGDAAADLVLDRLDATADHVALHAALGGTPLHLSLDGKVAAPGGRLLAQLLDRSEPMPVALRISGDGPLADWHGRLDATLGSAHVDARFDIAGGQGYRLTTSGSIEPGALLPPPLAALIGTSRLEAALRWNERSIDLERLSLATAAGGLDAHGHFDRAQAAILAAATLTLPELARFSPLVDTRLGGKAKATLEASGTLQSPQAQLVAEGETVMVGDVGLGRVKARVDLQSQGDPRDAATPIAIAAAGEVEDARPKSPLPARLGDKLQWRFAGTADRAQQRLKIDELALEGAGNRLSLAGTAAATGIAGRAHLALADIGDFVAGAAHGALALDGDFQAQPNGSADAAVSGTLMHPHSAQPVLDALLGDSVALAVKLTRSADGAVAFDQLSLENAQLSLGGSGRRSADGKIAAELTGRLPHLAVLEPDLGGEATLVAKIGGDETAPTGELVLTADDLAAQSIRLDRLEARLSLEGLAPARGRLDARFRRRGLEGRAEAEGVLESAETVRLPRLHLAANGSELDGALVLHPAAMTAEGSLRLAASSLAPWAGVLGTAIGGRAAVTAKLDARRGQAVDLTAEGSDLRWGGTASLHQFHLTARAADLFGEPSGQGELRLDQAVLGGTSLERAQLTARSQRAGSFSLQASAQGKVKEPFTLAAKAEASLGGAGQELRLVQLSGSAAGTPLALRRPLRLAHRGAEWRVADLDLSIGKGDLRGEGALGGQALSLRLRATELPLHPLAALAGEEAVRGVAGFELTLKGTRTSPEAHLALEGRELSFAAAGRPDLPGFALTAAADWSGRVMRLKGRMAAAKQAAIGFTGSLPLLLDRDALVPHLAPREAIALRLEGGGDIGEFADVLPTEDRIGGRVEVDINVAGTVAAPAVSGRVSLREGRYESLVAGASISGVNLDLVGNRDRLRLENFTASDGAGGTLSIAGAVDLAATNGPVLDFAGHLAKFRAVARDEGSATVSGDLSLAGTMAAPRLAAQLHVDAADLRLPDRLPQNIRPIAVTEVNSATGETLSKPEAANASPWLAVALDVSVDIPGPVFVRGRGLDSAWRGKLAVAGSTAAPAITGKLEVIRGTYSLIGKDFKLNQGTISFLGGKRLDPQIDLEAQASSSSVTAIVRVTGSVSDLKIALSSQPALPQDQILAQLLFGTDIGQVTAAQGLQIAQAAAALAGGGDLGVLDKLRTGLGLDRLSLGNANAGSALPGLGPGLGVPALSTTPGVPGSPTGLGVGTSAGLPGTPSAGAAGGIAGGAAVSAGKYVANGVYVGVTQGLSAGSSSVDVQIDVTRHITIETTAGGTGTGGGIGTGVGVSWKLNY